MTPEEETINLIFETWQSSHFTAADEARIERTYGRDVLDEVRGFRTGRGASCPTP